MSMFYHYNLEYAEVFVFDEFLVNQIHQGVTVRTEHNKMLREIVDKHFANKPLVYIGNRHFSYAVDPLTYIATSKIHNLLAMAIVANNEISRKNALLEKYFYDKPFEVFPTLSEAISWVHHVILVHNEQK
ncbi:hypothetical protein [Rasiella sp. SM2506]|uniref:hypothetical protein n=1 Tax=Rasiella sp. SM2506 TaxID=3423914 RepID=UPI003D7B272F